MAKRQDEWAVRARQALILSLGGVCVECGERELSALELDHINGRTWRPAQVASSQRVSIYRREAAEGLLRVLCGVCNRLARKTDDNGRHVPTSAQVERTVEIPF